MQLSGSRKNLADDSNRVGSGMAAPVPIDWQSTAWFISGRMVPASVSHLDHDVSQIVGSMAHYIAGLQIMSAGKFVGYEGLAGRI